MELMHLATSVWIKNREHKVQPDGRVRSGPFAGGVYRELKNQDSPAAKVARKMAAGAMYSDGAFSSITFRR